MIKSINSIELEFPAEQREKYKKREVVFINPFGREETRIEMRKKSKDYWFTVEAKGGPHYFFDMVRKEEMRELAEWVLKTLKAEEFDELEIEE